MKSYLTLDNMETVRPPCPQRGSCAPLNRALREISFLETAGALGARTVAWKQSHRLFLSQAGSAEHHLALNLFPVPSRVV